MIKKRVTKKKQTRTWRKKWKIKPNPLKRWRTGEWKCISWKEMNERITDHLKLKRVVKTEIRIKQLKYFHYFKKWNAISEKICILKAFKVMIEDRMPIEVLTEYAGLFCNFSSARSIKKRWHYQVYRVNWQLPVNYPVKKR